MGLMVCCLCFSDPETKMTINSENFLELMERQATGFQNLSQINPDIGDGLHYFNSTSL